MKAVEPSQRPVVIFLKAGLLAALVGAAVLLPGSPAGAQPAVWTAPAALNFNAATDGAIDDFSVDLATDGAGNWVAVWNAEGAAGADFDVLVARSADNGTTWTPPALLNDYALGDTAFDGRPRVATDGAGTWLAAWESNHDLGGTAGTDFDIFVARSTNNGVSWSTPAVLNSNAAADAGHDVAIDLTTDGAGNWVAVWQSNDTLGGTVGTDTDIFVARSTSNGATWTAPAALNSDAAGQGSGDTSPRLTTDGAGTWVATWQTFNGLDGTLGEDRDILFARSTNNGASWSAAAPLNSTAIPDVGDDLWQVLATDGLGSWVAVWSSNENVGGTIGTDRDILFARSTDDGVSWSAAAALNTNSSTDTGGDANPHIATDGAGNWVAVWNSEDSLDGAIDPDDDILIARSADAGATWTAPVALNANAASDEGSDFEPRLVTDGAGNWLAAWYSEETLGGTIGTDYDILFARSTGSGFTWWPELAVLNSNASFDVGSDVNPQVTTDGQGNWVGVWASDDSLDGTVGPDWDIFVRTSSDGITWGPMTVLNTNAGGDSGTDLAPQVTTDGAGNWVAVWHSDDSLGNTIGLDLDILVARSTDNGASWTPPVALNSNAATDEAFDFDAVPQVTTDGAGNWVAVWHSLGTLGGTIGADSDILVSRSTNNGATWTAPVALNANAATDSGHDFFTQVTTDGAGNWVAAWESTDSLNGTIGTDTDILVSHSTDGGATWTAPVPLNSNAGSDTGHDTRVQLTTDGGGTWVAVWTSSDTLEGTIGLDSDILFSRSTNNGVTWTAPLPLNSNAAVDFGDDVAPQVTVDTAGIWTAVWESTDSLNETIGFDRDILLTRSADHGATWTAPAALNTGAGTDDAADTEPQITTDGAGNWIAVWTSNNTFGGIIGGDEDILVARGCLWLDTDGDALSDCLELRAYGTDPFNADGDDDGLMDGEEASIGSDPHDIADPEPHASQRCTAPAGAQRNLVRSDVTRAGFVTAFDISTVISRLDSGRPYRRLDVYRSDVQCSGFVTAFDLSTVISNLDAVIVP